MRKTKLGRLLNGKNPRFGVEELQRVVYIWQHHEETEKDSRIKERLHLGVEKAKQLLGESNPQQRK